MNQEIEQRQDLPTGLPPRNTSVKEIIQDGHRKPVWLEERKRMYASSAANCVRYNTILGNLDKVLEYLDETPINVRASAELALYASIGEAVHNHHTSSMFYANSLLFREYKLPPITIGLGELAVTLNLGGRIDAFALVDGKIRGVEFKTTGSTLPSSPLRKHYLQALIYEALTGIPFIIKYTSRSVEAHGKEGINGVEFSVQSTEQQRKEVIFALLRSQYYNEKGIIAANELIEKVPQICEHCTVAHLCWNSRLDSISKDDAMLDFLAQQNTVHILGLTDKRRNGILKHIQKHGIKPFAQETLKGNWKELL